MSNPSEALNGAAGLAALSICESLILAMGDLKIMGEHEAVAVIKDAANAHRGRGTTPDERDLHSAVAAILDTIIAGGNSVRRK